MKGNKSKILMICAFAAMLCLPWILWYGWGSLWPAYQAAHSYELNENRNVYELEDGMENAFNDHIPFRSYLIHTYNRFVNDMDENYHGGLESDLIARWYHEELQTTEVLEDLSEIEWLIYGESAKEMDLMKAEDHIHDYYVAKTVEPTLDDWGYTLKVCNVCGEELKTDYVAKKIDTTYLSPVLNGQDVMVGRNDWLFVFDPQNKMSLYTGEKKISDGDFSARATILQKLQDVCDEKGVNFSYLIAPAKYQVYPEFLPTIDVAEAQKPTEKIVDYLRENTTSTVVYPLEELTQVKRYYRTYFRYDSHWNQIGAYVGTQVLYRDLGLETTPLYDMDIKLDESEETGWMDLIPLTGLEQSDFKHQDHDYVLPYKPDVHVTDGSGNEVFTEGSKVDVNMLPVEEYTSDSGNDGHIVVIGDSFRAMPRQYIAKDFKRSTFIHFYSFNGNDYLGNYGMNFEDTLAQIIADLDDADYLVFVVNEGYEEMAVHYQDVLRKVWQ